MNVRTASPLLLIRSLVATTILFTASLFSSSAAAEIQTKKVGYTHNGVQLTGYLAYDDELSGRAPGVVLFPEWWGHGEYIQKRARDFAAQGYIAFAADMYGTGVKGETAPEASALSKPFYVDRKLMRARAAAALDTLLATKVGGLSVNKERLAALGYCFGGTIALELARSGAPLAATVSFHGGLSTPNAADAKQITGSVLALNGANDPFVQAEERAAFAKEMRDAAVDWQFVEYGNALHAFSNPAVDAKGLDGAKYNAKADRRSFELTREFLRERLQQ